MLWLPFFSWKASEGEDREEPVFTSQETAKEEKLFLRGEGSE